MKFKVEHNPFFNETKIWQDNNLTKDEKYAELKNKRLIDIIDNIPLKFYEECNEDFTIDFIGRIYEYDDLNTACKRYNNEKKTDIQVIHKTQKYDSIDILAIQKSAETLFKESPIEEIKNDETIKRFLTKLNTEFEVAVVATMSSGKSTLINALLGQNILPARNEATTAKIFSIRDDDNKKDFSLELFDRNGKKVKSTGDTLAEQLENANAQKDVIDIRLHGDIPNISSSTANLVLLDTPGPNNSQNQEHKETTYKLIKDNEKNPLILYVLNAQQLTTDDANNLLEAISETIKRKNNDQTHDRFIFVLNKADGLKKDEVANMLKNTKDFLEKFGIESPKIFPISSSRALICRKQVSKIDLDDEEEDVLDTCKKVVEKERTYHYFEQDAPLSESQKAIIDERLKTAHENNDWLTQADIHSGIPSLEMVIDDYVNKYAIPMKIFDAFVNIEKNVHLNHQKDRLLKELEQNKTKIQENKKQLNEIASKIKSEKSIEEFKKKIEKIVINHDLIDSLTIKLEEKFDKLFKEEIFKNDMDIDTAQRKLDDVYATVSTLEADIKTTLEEQLKGEIKEKTNAILEEFKNEVLNAFQGLDLGGLELTLGSIGELSTPDKETILEKSSKIVEENDKEEVIYHISFWGIKLWEKERKWSKKKVEKSDAEKLREEFNEIKKLFKKSITEEVDNSNVSLEKIKMTVQTEITKVREKISQVVKEMVSLEDDQTKLEDSKKELEKTIKWIEEYQKIKEEFIR